MITILGNSKENLSIIIRETNSKNSNYLFCFTKLLNKDFEISLNYFSNKKKVNILNLIQYLSIKDYY
jgi:UDP-N-acetylglucosamine pyrophosphorylase